MEEGQEIINGLIVRSTGSWYDVLLDDGTKLQARIVGKLRLGDIKTTNPVAVGDRVNLRIEDKQAGTAIIDSVAPRHNYVVRQSPRKKHQLHLIAANIDQAMLIVTIVEPSLKQGFIDRFLLTTEPHNIPAVIVFNKLDLYDENALSIFHFLKSVYETIGYPCYAVSAITGEGIDEIRLLLKDKITLISGQSGVGKTSLINAVQPGLELRTGDISDYTGKGQHTTTFAEWFALRDGGAIIDTPGIKTLSFNNLEPMDVTHNFRELFAASDDCRFANCTHRNEPGCAVKEAVEKGEISELRYFNYIQIMEEVEDQNYWERHKDM